MSVNGLVVRVQCADCAVLWASRNTSRTIAEDLQLLRLPVERANRFVEALARALHPRQLGLDLLGQLGSFVEMRLEDVDFGARLLLGSMPTGGGGNHGTAVEKSAPFAMRMRMSEDLPRSVVMRKVGKGWPETLFANFTMTWGGGPRVGWWVGMESAEGIRGLKRPNSGWQARYCSSERMTHVRQRGSEHRQTLNAQGCTADSGARG